MKSILVSTFYKIMKMSYQNVPDLVWILNRMRDNFLGGWSYQFNCFDKLQYEEIKHHIFTMRELSRDEKDMYIMES